MPHLVIEYTNNLPLRAMKRVMLNATSLMAECGLFTPVDVKSRLLKREHYMVGDGADNGRHAFVSVELKLLAGRDLETKEALGNMLTDNLVRTLQLEVPQHVGLSTQVCVQVTEMPINLYFKEVIGDVRGMG